MNYKLSEILEAQEFLQSLKIDSNKNKKQIDKLLEKFNCKNTDDLINFLDRERKTSHRYYFKLVNNDNFRNMFENEKEYLKQRSVWENKYMSEKISSLVAQYTDWKFPVTYFEPNTGDLLRHIISGDPFYIIDDFDLPTKMIIKNVPEASKNKFLKYTRKEAEEFFEENSSGLTVSYKNIPFKKLAMVEKDIKLMSKITKPGGYIIFDYIDCSHSVGARLMEEQYGSFQWKDRIYRYLDENNLTVIKDFSGKDQFKNGIPSEFNLCICQKNGKTKKINLVNKLGLVSYDKNVLDRKRQIEEQDHAKRLESRSKLQQDLKRITERDKVLRDIEEKRSAGKENVLELKLENSIQHLNQVLSMYEDYTHPSVLEALLHASKLTYSLGRIKDSKNLIKRVERDIAKMSSDNFIARKYREWQDFLNNIDT